MIRARAKSISPWVGAKIGYSNLSGSLWSFSIGVVVVEISPGCRRCPKTHVNRRSIAGQIHCRAGARKQTGAGQIRRSGRGTNPKKIVHRARGGAPGEGRRCPTSTCCPALGWSSRLQYGRASVGVVVVEISPGARRCPKTHVNRSSIAGQIHCRAGARQRTGLTWPDSSHPGWCQSKENSPLRPRPGAPGEGRRCRTSTCCPALGW